MKKVKTIQNKEELKIIVKRYNNMPMIDKATKKVGKEEEKRRRSFAKTLDDYV